MDCDSHRFAIVIHGFMGGVVVEWLGVWLDTRRGSGYDGSAVALFPVCQWLDRVFAVAGALLSFRARPRYYHKELCFFMKKLCF